MGASSVVLLGIDCEYETPEKTDFYGKNEQHRPHTLRNFHRAMKFARRECPIPVYNGGRVEYWPKKSLSSTIKELKPKKLSRIQWVTKLRCEKPSVDTEK